MSAMIEVKQAGPAIEFAQFVREKVGPTAALRSFNHQPGRDAFVRLYVEAWRKTAVEVDLTTIERVAGRANKMWDKFVKSQD